MRRLYPSDRHIAWSELPVADSVETLARIDGYVLQSSIELLEQLDVRRNGATLFTRSQAEIAAAQAGVGTPLAALQRTSAWVDIFRSWLGETASARTDAVQIARALSSYMVGVKTVSLGPECGPISGAYQYGFVSQGMPGDATPELLTAEVRRSEAEIRTQIAMFPTTRCITSLHPSPSGNFAPTRVIVELPAQPAQWTTDTQVWSEGSDGARVRAGVPVPPVTTPWRGSQAY